MGKAYSDESREQVKLLLQQNTAEDEIEKQTGVSDRTIRRWKLELERYGRIGKPPESRTGRHRVMNKDVEKALFDHVAQQPELSVDDMLWWLYDKYKLVVGTRTIRRAFERRNTSHKKFRCEARKDLTASGADSDDLMVTAGAESMLDQSHLSQPEPHYQSPYAPMLAPNVNNGPAPCLGADFSSALGHMPQLGNDNSHIVNLGEPSGNLDEANNDDLNVHPGLAADGAELSEDEETLQLQLQQIALQKREVELKLKMRRLQKARLSSHTPSISVDGPEQSFFTELNDTPSISGSALPSNATPTEPRPRESRSKNKVEEAKRRTEERQEKMLKDLEKRSRRREHLTAEWVQSRDVWAKGPEKLLGELMHRHGTYAYNQNSVDTFENIFRELYQLVDHTDWYSPVHDDLLRERTRRKMSQLRTKMVKSGEIISRGEGYGGWSKPDDSMGGIDGPIDLTQSDMQDLGDLPLELALAAEARNHQSEEAMLARDAMMHTHDTASLLQHHNLHHPHTRHHTQHPQGLMSDSEMHAADFAQQQHSEHLARQHALLAQRGMAQHEHMSHQSSVDSVLGAGLAHQDDMTL